MRSFSYIFIFLLLINVMVACGSNNGNESSIFSENDDGQIIDGTEYPTDDMGNKEESQENLTPAGSEGEERQTDENQQEKTIEEFPEEEMPEEETPKETSEVKPEDVDDKNSGIEEMEEVETLAFPFEEFIERWNALSDEHYSGLYISSFDAKKGEDNRTIYRHPFKNGFVLSVMIGGEKRIEEVRLEGSVKTEDQRFALLTAWSQLVLMTNPAFELYDVNQVFHEIGIGPNATIPNKNKTTNYQGIEFSLTQNNTVLLFNAKFEPNTTQ